MSNENEKIINTQNEIKKNMEIELRKKEASIQQNLYDEDKKDNNNWFKGNHRDFLFNDGMYIFYIF